MPPVLTIKSVWSCKTYESNEGKMSISIRFNAPIKIINTIFWAIFEIIELAYNEEKCLQSFYFYWGMLQPAEHKADHL